MSLWKLSLAGVAALAVALVSWALFGTLAAQPPGKPPLEDRMRPRWAVGDSWVIAAVTRPLQERNERKQERGAEDEPKAVQWQFKVDRTEKLGPNECYVVVVSAVEDPKNQPQSKLWVDAKSMAIRQLETQLPVREGFATVTESYQFGEGQPGPVLPHITALPLELPMFIAGRAGEQVFNYEARSGTATARRDAGDVGFSVDVSQSVTPMTQQQAQAEGKVPKQYTRDLEAKPLAEVRMKTKAREVHQIWQATQPWPVYSNNGTTEARLVSVNRK